MVNIIEMLTLISSIERFAGILLGVQEVIHFRAFHCQTPSEKLHTFISAPENYICFFFSFKKKSHSCFQKCFFRVSASNKLSQIIPHFGLCCSDKSLKQHSKLLESVDSRSLTFRIEIRAKKSLKATLSPRVEPRKICKGSMELMETPLEIFTLSLNSVFPTVFCMSR